MANAFAAAGANVVISDIDVEAGLEALTHSLAVNLTKEQVRVNAIALAAWRW
jgi:hypothetical protein